MAAPLVPQEIYLQERYVSIGYFEEMRDAWSAMVNHAETCLDVFMRDLPSDYRSRGGEHQPDIVWGQRVLVNFRVTQQFLIRGYIELTHGNFDALRYAGAVMSDFAGFVRDYSADWMDEPAVARVVPNGNEVFRDLMEEATMRAFNILSTYESQWRVGALSERYSVDQGPLDPPSEWPTYITNPKVRAVSGEACQKTGIYLPDIDEAAAGFFIVGKEVWSANVGYDPETTQRLKEEPCGWTLVERLSDRGGGVPGDPDPIRAGVRLRCEAGQACPRAGWWFTPAHASSRRQFRQGEPMPAFGSDYGITIWQWDGRQES